MTFFFFNLINLSLVKEVRGPRLGLWVCIFLFSCLDKFGDLYQLLFSWSELYQNVFIF